MVRNSRPRVRAASSVARRVDMGLGRVPQRRDEQNCGEDLFQQLQWLTAELDSKPRKASDVAAGVREARGQTSRDRIGAECRPDNWDRARSFVCDLSAFSAIGNDDVYGEPDQFASHRGQPAGISGNEPIFNRDVLALDIAVVAQSFTKGIKYLGREPFGR